MPLTHILEIWYTILDWLVNEAKHLQKQLGPVSKALDRLKSDSSTLADACEVWVKLLQTEELVPYMNVIGKWFKQVMTSSHFLANILHPMYMGTNLNPKQISSAQELLQEQHPELVPCLLKFMCNKSNLSNAWTNENTIKNVSSVVWWMSVEHSNEWSVNPLLCQLARKLLSMPASSAAIERIFSNFGSIQTKLRNRLGLQKWP